MNEQLRHPLRQSPATKSWRQEPGKTQAADGLPRRAWTAEEVHKMMAAGIIEHGERFELVGGELIAMAAKGIPHETLKIALNLFWGKIRPPHIAFAPESGFRAGPLDEPEPEFFVYPVATPPNAVRGDTVLLIVEIAASSLGRDRTVKALRYAMHGVREYWLVDARTRVTTVFQEPKETGFARRFDVPGTDRLTPLLVPELGLRFDDLV